MGMLIRKLSISGSLSFPELAGFCRLGIALLLIVSVNVACTQAVRTPYPATADTADPSITPVATTTVSQSKYMNGLTVSHPVVFSYPPQSIEVEQSPWQIKQFQARGGHLRHSYSERIGQHQVSMLQFPSIGDNAQTDNLVSVRYYQSRKPGRKPLVIVLPIFGSYTYPTERIANGIRQRHADINVAVFLAEEFLLDFEGLAKVSDAEAFTAIVRQMRQRIITSVVDIQRFIDWAQHQPDIDPQRIGLVGFSMSALVAGLAALSEPRLQATAVVMGAGEPHNVLSVCSGRPGQARSSVLQSLGWTVDDYRRRMQEIFADLEPINYTHRANPAAALMIDAARDDCMPQSARDAMWQALGYPERISYQYSHKKAFLTMTPLGFNVMRREIYRFLDERMELTRR